MAQQASTKNTERRNVVNLATRAAFMVKAKHEMDKALLRLNEVSTHLTNDEEYGALGAISGLSSQIQYIETLLTVMTDLEKHERRNE
jgi:hypothetical protein